MTFRSILVPLDGSPFGEHALPHALALARRAGAAVELAHACEPVSLWDVPTERTPEDEDRRATGRALAYLADVARRVRAAAPAVGVTTALLHGSADALHPDPDATKPDRVYLTAVLRGGPVADALCGYAAEARPDLIVMTTHGRGPLSRFWLGSVATAVAQSAPGPLLLVRPAEGAPDLAADPAPGRVLIALDGSPFGEAAVPPATAVGALTGAAYRLVRVSPPVLVSGGDGLDPLAAGGRTVADELAAGARGYLAALAARVPALRAAEVQVAVDWPPAAAILADAETARADLIALATRGRSNLARLLLGSVADKVVRGATAPVLLCRPESDPSA